VLSVVIPTYNTASMTLRCVRAIQGADEVIVVDDGSTDDTVALLSPEVRVVSLEKNSGFAVAANRGVAESRGDRILLLNSDAIVEPDALSALMAAFEADPRLGVAGAQLLNEDGSRQWSGGLTPTLAWMIGVVSGAGGLARLVPRRKSQMRVSVDWVSGAAMMFRREAWKPFDERYLFYCQDIDFCLDARKAGWDVRIVDGARVTHGLGRTVARGSIPHDPARLWPDLLTWGRNYYGQTWARRTRVVLIGIAALRIAWRKLRFRSAAPLVRGLTALRKT
jgi:hypothetical protein